MWFRRDMRLHDNTALYHALQEHEQVLPVFIFDTTILDKLEDRDDRRVTFIHQTLHDLREQLADNGSSMHVYYGDPMEVWPQLLNAYNVAAVYTNRDYEPYARERDAAIADLLDSRGIEFKTYKDHIVLEPEQVLKPDGNPYTVFTPYMKRWKATLTDADLVSHPSEQLLHRLVKTSPLPMPTLEALGFTETADPFPAKEVDTSIIDRYHTIRDIPSVKGTTRLSVHLRFGTVSIRELTRIGMKRNERWYNELIWRNFYQMIIWHHPQVVEQNFNSAYDQLPWRNNENEFKAWCRGETGYPIVDAGMRELMRTGFMHNRVRMITACFLSRHLLIDWRWGEAWFARHLIDFELASNNGGWQWAAGTGCDAAPYFRIFNPTSQTAKFDPEHKYIKKWVPEYQELTYPQPIVEHKFARERALKTYKEHLQAVPA